MAFRTELLRLISTRLNSIYSAVTPSESAPHVAAARL